LGKVLFFGLSITSIQFITNDFESIHYQSAAHYMI
jgi:hypothetical protein